MNNNIDATSSKSCLGRSAVRTVLATLATLGGLMLMSPAWSAERSDDVLSTVVSYADLNLNSRPGAKVLYGRLQSAAHRVCRPLEGRHIADFSRWRTCVDQATARAVEQIDKPELTAYYLGRISKTGVPVMIAKSGDKH